MTEKLEKEAKKFIQQKRKAPPKPKPLTSRRYLAGQVLSGLLARSQGVVNWSEMKREAFQVADMMLEDD